MKKEMTERATALVEVVKKIESWCNENIADGDIKVFNLTDHHGVYMWWSWVYSTTYKKLYFARGDHSRWGANYGDIETGMTDRNFDYYMFSTQDPADTNYKLTNEDGNLIFEDEIIVLMKCWNSIKERLIESRSDTQRFENFQA